MTKTLYSSPSDLGHKDNKKNLLVYMYMYDAYFLRELRRETDFVEDKSAMDGIGGTVI